MELHPLDPLELREAAARGNARAIVHRELHRQPRTVAEVLADASRAMDEQDAREARERDPVAWARAHRPWRLIDRLLGRR